MTIFWRILLGFLLTTAVVVVFAFISIPDTWLRAAIPQIRTPEVDLRSAVDAFEQNGERGFHAVVNKTPAMGRSVMLFAADGRVLVEGNVPESQWRPMVLAVQQDKTPRVERYDYMVGLATPIQSSSGRQYVLVLSLQKYVYDPLHRRVLWLRLTAAVLPGLLVCAGLTFFITRPLAKLRFTVRQLAKGDLRARPGAIEKGRRDEIGELSRDVDSMADRIEELLVAQRRFVASVAHELGAPLTRMQLATTLLSQDISPGHLNKLALIERENDRLSHLVQELLFLASLEQGTLPAERLRTVSLAELCRDVIRDNSAEAEEKECVIRADMEDVQVSAAPQTLRRAIENIFRNAVRHTVRGSSISIACYGSRSSDSAVITIADSGQGVPEEMLTSIFQPFVRVPGQTKAEGSGLGLTIALDAVTLHGGTITAANGAEGGLVVTVRLPCET